jgi:ribosomal protein S18 acetylase RimI-like enzyme
MPSVNVEDAQEQTKLAILQGLVAHNMRHGGAPSKPDEFVVALRDDHGALIGGMTCDISYGGLLIEWAWIDEAYRGQGHGRALLDQAEAHGARRGAVMAHLDTFIFQARGFYERCGYRVFGVLSYPGEIERYYMHKALVPVSA